MCSIVEEDFGDEGGAHVMTADPEDTEEETCKKCKTEKSVIKSMCHNCFLNYVRHKFRGSLGCTKIVRRGSNVLLHFSGSAANVCLTEMIRFAFEQESHKRLSFDLELVYIDENCVLKEGHDDPECRLKKLCDVRTMLEQFPNFKCHYTSIAGTSDVEFILTDDVKLKDVENVIANEAKFLKKFNALKSLSSQQDLLEMTRNDLLRYAATFLKCQYVFLSDISTTLADRFITNMALGRGSSVGFDVAFCDDRIESLKFIRPIKDVSDQEVAGYIKLENLKNLDVPKYGHDQHQFASIQNLTSKFISDLQGNFSSTVSTVYRTCSKVAPVESANAVKDEMPETFLRNLEVVNMNQRCAMCKSYLDYQNSETLFAINFSRFVSEAAGNEERLKVGDYEESSESSQGIKKQLCHGCRNIFIGLNDEELEDLF